MKFFFAPVHLFWKHRILLYQTVRNDIRARYAGSVLGLAWLFIYPLIFLSIYSMVYLYVHPIGAQALLTRNEYIVFIFCGLIPFLGFAEALGSGVSSVTSNANLIKNTLFPIELIPVKTVLVSQCIQVVGTLIIFVGMGILGKFTLWVLLFPVVWLCQILFTLGIIWILSSLNVYLRDLQNIVAIAILMLMVSSPIAFTAELIMEKPPIIQRMLSLNPLYHLMVSYQDCLIMGHLPREGTLWVSLGMGIITFLVGYWFFSRMKKVFADNV